MKVPMTPRFEALNPERHAGWLLGPHAGYDFLRRLSAVEVMVNECHRVACDLPVVWRATGSETLGMSAILPPGRDWPIDSEGRWLGTYLPLLVRVYPFVPGEPGPAGTGAYVDVHSPMVCPPGQAEGDQWHPWFDGKGAASPALNAVLEVLRGVHRARQESVAMGRALQQLQLLRPLPHHDGASQIYLLDVEAMGKVPPPVEEVFKRRGWMKAAYAQVQSLAHLDVQRFESDEGLERALSTSNLKRKSD